MLIMSLIVCVDVERVMSCKLTPVSQWTGLGCCASQRPSPPSAVCREVCEVIVLCQIFPFLSTEYKLPKMALDKRSSLFSLFPLLDMAIGFRLLLATGAVRPLSLSSPSSFRSPVRPTLICSDCIRLFSTSPSRQAKKRNMPPKKNQEKEKKILLGRPSNNLKIGIVGMPPMSSMSYLFFSHLIKQ